MKQALDLTPIRNAVKADLPPSKHALADLTVDLIGGLFADVHRTANALERIAAVLEAEERLEVTASPPQISLDLG